MERYEELAVKAMSDLRTPRVGLQLYPEYYKKAIGQFVREFYVKVSGKI